jgi:hypothetical protein
VRQLSQDNEHSDFLSMSQLVRCRATSSNLSTCSSLKTLLYLSKNFCLLFLCTSRKALDWVFVTRHLKFRICSSFFDDLIAIRQNTHYFFIIQAKNTFHTWRPVNGYFITSPSLLLYVFYYALLPVYISLPILFPNANSKENERLRQDRKSNYDALFWNVE